MDKILVVEDEEYIREFIIINLNRSNFSTFEAQTGEKALEILLGNEIDLVLLDIKLPGIDGYKVCKEIRTKYPQVAIIMVTAKNHDMDKIMGLELGADDYVAKPFNPNELIARIRSVIRRTKKESGAHECILAYGTIKIDLRAHKVFNDDNEIHLTPKEFEIVRILSQNPGSTYKRNQLFDTVWGDDFYGDTKTLDVHIRRIREKLEDNPTKPNYIETVWGVGYRWKDVK
jgi:DNA-binding response OmpR family regulator